MLKIKYLNKDKRIENKKFKKVIKRFIKTKQIAQFTHNELSEILINFLTILDLIKKYSNVYFELNPKTGLITELDLSDYLEYEVKGTPFGWKNNIQSLSELLGLKYLKSLKKIDLSNNNIDNIKDLIHLKELTHLILANNNIKQIENLTYILSLKNLQYLDLRGNEIGNQINLDNFNKKIKVILKDSLLY
jgi:Leucine-rich repeat (LRR) protein